MNSHPEEWRTIVEFPFYQVSNLGRVRSLHGRKTSGILKQQTDKYGYYGITLRNKVARKRFLVHRLVAIAFIDNPHNKPQVNHKDGNKLNNSVPNLEWVTNKENKEHAVKNGLAMRGVKQWKSKLNKHKVREIRKAHQNGEATILELAEKYNVHKFTIGCVIRRHTWKHVS